MSDYDNTNKGALFQAKEKKTDKHPDYDGSINVDGHDYWVSGWKKVSKNGNTFLSLSVKRKDGTAARPDKAKEFEREVQKTFPDAKVKPLGLDDEVPF